MGRNPPPSTPEQLAEREQARAAKLAALHSTLTEQVAALRDGQDWQRWLTVAARLPHYSLNNVLLIAAQRPHATAVAGFAAWKALGRHVDKGQKGIAILAPILRRPHPGPPSSKDSSNTDRDPSPTGIGGPTPPDDPTQPGQEATDRTPAGRAVSAFTVAYVFDVSQTSGPPLPQQPAPTLLTGQVPAGLWDALAAQVSSRGFTLRRGDCGPGVNGLTHYGQHTVTVRSDVDDAQAVKTLIHELAHVLLHDPTGPQAVSRLHPGPAGLTSAEQCRGRIEVEAESVAYLIAASHGLDTGDYTFPYVAGWASSVDGAAASTDTVVRQTAQRVLTAARTVLADLDTTTAVGVVDLALAATSAIQADAQRGAAATAALLRTATDTEQAAGQAALRSAAQQAAQRAVAEQAGRPRQAGPPTGGRLDPVPAERLLHAHELAVTFYTARLRAGPDGQSARALLAARGLDAATADRARLGYAPRAWTRLVDQLRTAAFCDGELLASGLAIPTSRGTLVDRFRDRIVFPITDTHGRTVALIGRAVDDRATDRSGQPVPKYLNSPDTSLYRKGETLYGLGPARAALAAGARPVLVEGPMDALAINLANTRAAAGREGPGFVGVAPCGTALTATQVDLLDNATGGLADRGVVVAFDGDDAGRQAGVRAYRLLRQAGAWPHALDLPAGQDPAGVLQQHGPPGLHVALLSAADRPLADLVIDERIDRYADQLRWPEGQIAAGRAAATVVVTLPTDQVPRQVVRLAAKLHLPASTVSGMVVDALTDPARTPTGSDRRASAVQQPELPPWSASIRPAPAPARRATGGTLTPVQRARAGFPSPVLAAPSATPDAATLRPVTTPMSTPLRRRA